MVLFKIEHRDNNSSIDNECYVVAKGMTSALNKFVDKVGENIISIEVVSTDLIVDEVGTSILNYNAWDYLSKHPKASNRYISERHKEEIKDSMKFMTVEDFLNYDINDLEKVIPKIGSKTISKSKELLQSEINDN